MRYVHERLDVLTDPRVTLVDVDHERGALCHLYERVEDLLRALPAARDLARARAEHEVARAACMQPLGGAQAEAAEAACEGV